MKKSLVGVLGMPGFSKFIFNWCPFLRHFVYFQTSGNWFVTVRVEIFKVLSVNLSRKKFSLSLTLAMVTSIFFRRKLAFLWENFIPDKLPLSKSSCKQYEENLFRGKIVKETYKYINATLSLTLWMYNLDLLRLNPPKVLFNKLTIQMWYPSPKRVVHDNASWI